MIVVFLLCVVAGVPAEGHSLDVCATCQANATCDDKPDGSGKVCNCQYGFVGNGRTFCIDKDECQIGASRICGQHTTCHNTYGSYYCTCLSGWSPSNNLHTFIPNDGTYCQDDDECRITGLCGDGAQCRNLEGSFDCSCQLGYQVHNGVEPFHPHTSKASCKVVDCGQPASVEDAVLLSVTSSTYSSVAMFVCDNGFVWRSGDNSSVCGADGRWTGSTMVCEEVDCGSPPDLPHSHALWNKSSRMGTELVYQCNPGYHNVGKGNVSVCTAAGWWERPSMLCQEAVCGSPPVIESTELVWNHNSTLGSTVLYVCKGGFYSKGGLNMSMCNENGQWTPPTLLCQEILCGDPPILPHTGKVWNSSSTPGSTVTYYCKIGFHHNEGNNASLCTINGYWTKPNISCKEVDCGAPTPIPHSIMLWDKIPTLGSQVVYQCNSGYRSVGKGKVSVCTAGGLWDGASLLCPAVNKSTQQSVGLPAFSKKINCPEPVFKPHANMLWNGTSHVGSVVYHRCEEGYYTRGLRNYSVCGENGLWEDIDLWCEDDDECRITGLCGDGAQCRNLEGSFDCSCQLGYQVHNGVEPFHPHTSKASCKVVDCGQPASVEDAVLLSVTGSTYSSVAMFVCDNGFVWRSGDNSSVCGADGRWTGSTMVCEEISCGPPLTLPHTNLVWDGTSRPGSVVLYECLDGFYQESGNNISTCLLSRQWGKVSVKCKAKCGPVPFLAKSEVMWHNRSVVIHRCVDGYHSWRGSNVSVCGSSGVWKTATLRCIEIKPPVNHLFVRNEKCLQWRAEKYEEDIEVYKVTYIGSRDYQGSFHERRKRFLTSKADQLQLCLNLLPATNYSITITAVSSAFTATITTNTSLSVPPTPVVYYREFETPVPTLRLRRSPNTLDPISLYQVFVLPVERIVMFDCSSAASSDSRKMKSSTEYITAQIYVRHVGTEMNFTVGDGLYYEGFFNAPLEDGRNYYILLRTVSQWKSAFKSSCVLWANVRGTSYVLKVSSLAAAALIGLVALVIWGGYCFTWVFKRTRHS